MRILYGVAAREFGQRRIAVIAERIVRLLSERAKEETA
jgi:hypothetical protein